MGKRIEDQIDEFILDEMTTEERTQFENELSQNDGLNEKYQIQKALINGINYQGNKRLKRRLQKIHKDEIIEDSPNKSYWALLGLMLIIATVFIGDYLVKANRTYTPEELYMAHFEPYEYDINSRSLNISDKSALVELYKNKKYSLFVTEAGKFRLETSNSESDLLLAIGIAYLEIDLPEQAIVHFQKITVNGDFNYKDEVAWYTSLAYLKLEKPDQAKPILQGLAEDIDADHHIEAKKLLKKM